MSLLPPLPLFGPLSGRAPQQDAARFSGRNFSGRNGEPGSATLVNRRPQDGPREFLSFLTWPFFLAQLLAANELLAKTNASPVAEEPSEAERAAEAMSRAAPDADPANLAGMMNGDGEEPVAAEVESGGTTEEWFAELDDLRPVAFGDPTDLVMDAAEPGRPTSFGGGGGGSGSSAQGGQQSVAAADVAECSTKPGCAGTGVLPDSVPPPIAQLPLPPILDDIAGPIAGAGDALETVGDTVIAVTAPVLDTTAEVVGGVVEAVLGPVATAVDVVGGGLETTLPVVGGIVTTVIQPVAPILDGVADVASAVIEPVVGLAQSAGAVVEPVTELVQQASAVVEPVLDLAGDRLADTTQSIAPAAQPVVATIADAVGGVTEDIAAPHVADLMSDTLSASSADPDLAETSTPIATPVATVLEDALHLGDHQGDLGSGGMLSFADPPAPPTTDALFAAGKYTDYGIALSGMPDVPDAPTATPDPAAQDHPQDAAADDAAPAGDAPTTTLLATAQPLPSLIDEVGLRSSDGLL